ncbi:MAG: metalloregulator ArsR/SmtB family transcription factor [Leptospiraceae bacterium]|nr:metalloregulator ArsR/SmtB family transcription factor [Leptospiraceae bacterium]
MGVTKLEGFTEKQIEIAKIAKAISHPARVAILEELLKKTCICSDLVSSLPLAQATISQHLKELKSVGLIEGEIEGNSICYYIHQKNWNYYRKFLEVFFKQINQKNNHCC